MNQSSKENITRVGTWRYAKRGERRYYIESFQRTISAKLAVNFSAGKNALAVRPRSSEIAVHPEESARECLRFKPSCEVRIILEMNPKTFQLAGAELAVNSTSARWEWVVDTSSVHPEKYSAKLARFDSNYVAVVEKWHVDLLWVRQSIMFTIS
jgi:hypothetical protein